MRPIDRLESVVYQVAERRFGERARQRKALHRAILRLSEAYNQAKPTPRATALDDLLARLLFFTLADLPKICFPLAELAARDLLPAGPLRVLDLGAGCGAQTLGAMLLLEAGNSRRALHVDAVDHHRDGLAVMQDVVAALAERESGIDVQLQVHAIDLPHDDLPGAQYELILAGSVLAELPPADHRRLLDRWMQHLAPNGSLIIIEPALRSAARRLHQLRDHLLCAGKAVVVAPCTRSGPCPALANATDWCHESRPWTPPPRLRELAAATGLRRGDLKWAYLTLRHPTRAAADAGWFRVVSSRRRSKGKEEYFLCGSAGRLRATRLNRHRSASNQAFGRLHRGALVQLAGIDLGGASLRVSDESAVAVDDPAGCARQLFSAER